MPAEPHDLPPEAVAIIGMACRLPGAPDVEAFWRNLVDGVESIRRFTPEELIACGIDAPTFRQPGFVPAGALIDDHDRFDAGFFGFTPREAQVMDPQHRVFFECVWAALEDAGCDPARCAQSIGLFAGTSLNTYLLYNLVPNPDIIDAVGLAQAYIASDKDFLATHVSYKLNLRGPSLTVQTACSTSLVAVQLAYHGLLTYQCDVALAGGVSVQVPHLPGYQYQEGGIASPDGHCRAFDAAARGTVRGNGAGIVVLKRLSDALADGDRIVAVLRGAAVNNDGAVKVGFTAPGVDGQTEVISMAQALSGIEADSIGFIEAHGTGTPLGDPVEVAALTRVFRAGTPRVGFCALGSVKSNIGHLDAAAGIAGLIKAALAVERGVIPPTVNFSAPNPQLHLETSPFYVNATAASWPSSSGPRRAGVSSFGIGGTNAHVVLEEAPARPDPVPGRRLQVLPLSARTATALSDARRRLAAHLRDHAGLDLADVAWTLQVGRGEFAHRCAVVADTPGAAADALERPASGSSESIVSSPPRVVFLLPGQGAQYAGMAAGLLRDEPVFAEEFDAVAALFRSTLGLDLRDVVAGHGAGSDGRIAATGLAQPALFAVEYALSRWWMRMGVAPAAMIGHSLGEYVAACLADVMRLEDAVAIVAARARLMQALAPGAMVAVRLAEAEAQSFLDASISLAVVNAPRSCVLSGPPEAIERLGRLLRERDVDAQPLHTSHAFHSAMMDPILDAFRAEVRRIHLRRPAIPYVSNLTGTWIQPEEAMDPDYWVRHLRQPVRFADGLRTLLADPSHLPVETGPGHTLTRLARAVRPTGSPAAIAAMPAHDAAAQDDEQMLMTAVGSAWAAGVSVDWRALHGGRRRRVPLPAYAFDRSRYWIDPPAPGTRHQTPGGAASVDGYLYVPYWRRVGWPARPVEAAHDTVLIFTDAEPQGPELAAALAARGDDVVVVRPGSGFARDADGTYRVGAQPADYAALFSDLTGAGRAPTKIFHLWGIAGQDEDSPPSAGAPAGDELVLRRGFASLLWIAQATGGIAAMRPIQMVVVTEDLLQVHERDEPREPWRAAMLGPCFVIPQEYPGFTCQLVDLEGAAGRNGAMDPHVIDRLLGETPTDAGPPVVAYRGQRRWERSFELCAPMTRPASRLSRGGVYWMTGGTGAIGLALGAFLAREYAARLVFTQRSPLPARDAWDDWLETHQDDDPTSARVRALQQVEALGADVLVVPADVTDLDQMRDAAQMIRDRFGRIDGIVHAAGLPGGGLIPRKTIDAAAAVMAPKMRGAENVGIVARAHGVGFVALCSSIAGLQGGFGQIDYAGANAALDAFAAWQTATGGVPTFAIDWDAWVEGGMAVEAQARLRTRLGGDHDPRGESGVPSGDAPVGLRDAEGAEAFRRIVDGRHAQVAVSTVDLLARIEGQRRALETMTSREVDGAQPQAEASGRPGPALLDLEPRIAQVWERVLGVPQVAWHDNFFELGGDSLAGVQVIAHLNREIGLQLTVPQFFEAPTVAALAALVRGPDAPGGSLPGGHPVEASRDRGRLRRESREQRRANRA